MDKFFQEKEQRSSQSKFSHRGSQDPKKRESVVRLLAPNLDQLIIVTSFGTPAFKPGMVDRLLTLASLESLAVVLVINKADLGDRAAVESAARIYRGLGVDTLVTSVSTGEGVEHLRERLKDRSSGFSGHSGVGKSSLLMAAQPGLEGVRAGEVSEAIGKGKHTSTEVRCLALPDGGRVFDLPGLKLAPVCGIDKTELAEHFPDFEGAVRRCRFDDCIHDAEPDCGVKEQVGQGLIAESRYRSYLRLLSEL